MLKGDIPSQGEILPVNKTSARGNGHTRSFRNHLLRTVHELGLHEQEGLRGYLDIFPFDYSRVWFSFH